MSIPAEYLLPQDMVLVKDLETGLVTTWHATDAKEALLHDEGRYELVLPTLPPRPSLVRPQPLDANYLAQELRAADPERSKADAEHAEFRAMEDAERAQGPREHAPTPADEPQTLNERAAATQGPLDH